MTGQSTINLLSIPQNNSVTINKIDFKVPNDNRFNGEYVKDIGIFSFRTGKVISVTGGRSIIIPVVGNRKYFIKKFGTSNRFRVSLSNSLTIPIVGDTLSKLVKVTDTGDSLELTTNSSSTYLIINISSVGEEPRLTVTEGKLYDEFIPYSLIDKNTSKPNKPR